MLQHVEMTARHPAVTAQEALAVLKEIEDRVSFTGVVQSVRTEPLPDGTRASSWEVRFREGVLVWTQRDEFFEDEHVMRFSRLAGDPAVFEGEWRAIDADRGCLISFSCDFDLGIPSLSATLDPLAARILTETIAAQLMEIFGPELIVGEAQAEAAAAT